MQIATFVCDLVSTGATLEANGLRAVETVLESQAVLIRTRKARFGLASRIAAGLLSRIDGVLATKESKYIMLNAPDEALGRSPPSCRARRRRRSCRCTAGAGHFAVHAVCQESVFWETLQKLKGAGASAILVLPIEKMML